MVGQIPKELVEELRKAKKVGVLTGAGISAESKIPTFRDAMTGLWASFSPEELATPEAFARNPRMVWDWYAFRRDMCAKALPNPGHLALAELEKRYEQFTLTTQNVDGLHQRAGSHHVLEVHGSFRRLRCLDCGGEEGIESLFSRFSEADLDSPPRCLRCGSTKLKPDVVLFGESLPAAFQTAEAEARSADVMLVMGTSLNVYPVAGLVPLAKRNGAKLVILNREPTVFDEDADLVIHRELGTVSRELISMLGLG